MLYDLLKICVSVFFNTLNVLLGGNLPPLGSAAVIVEEHDHYLVVELPRGRVAFPGGFMIWREHPKQTAQREAQEETGLLVRVGDLIGTYSSISEQFTSMSVVSLVYAAERRITEAGLTSEMYARRHLELSLDLLRSPRV